MTIEIGHGLFRATGGGIETVGVERPDAGAWVMLRTARTRPPGSSLTKTRDRDFSTVHRKLSFSISIFPTSTEADGSCGSVRRRTRRAGTVWR
jgi:hypothetical protein